MASKIVSEIDVLRKAGKILKRDLAKRAGISPAYYRKIIKGNASPTIGVVESLAAEVGCRVLLVRESVL